MIANERSLRMAISYRKIFYWIILAVSTTACLLSKENRTFEQVSELKNLTKVGQLWENSAGIEFVFIPRGKFEMGSNISHYESPVHQRTITPFGLSATEITIGSFSLFMNDVQAIDSAMVQFGEDFPMTLTDEKWRIKEGINPEEPIVWITYLGAKAFCKWMSLKEGYNYRLPSEAEWEYACRAETKTNFFFGEKISSGMANFNGMLISDFGIKSEFREKPLPVKSFIPNKWGLYDMHGNVWEFCKDSWHDSFVGTPTDQSAWMEDGDKLLCVIKGGSWFSDDKEVRSAVRFGEPIREANAAWGFRVAVDLVY